MVSAQKFKQYYKRFANGEQYIKIDPNGEIVTEDLTYHWQSRGIYNKIKPLICSLGKNLTETQLYGKNGLVALLEPYQRAYNKIMNLHNEHIEFATRGYMAVEDGSVDVDELSEEGLAPGKIVVYRQGSSSPYVIQGDLKTTAYLESAEYYSRQMISAAEMFIQKEHNAKV